MNYRRAAALGAVLALAALAFPTAAAHYVPVAGDGFSYAETISVVGGLGAYQGYTETTYINGSVNVGAVAANGTESATYANEDHYVNSSGANEHWPESGTFTFSAVNFSYVHGTDNLTGYTHPSVWFFMNDSLGVGATFTDLDTTMGIHSLHYDYPLQTAAGAYVETIFAVGNSSYARQDSYGSFDASYTWQSYYDPTTGYIVGYLYTETDRNASGDGFTLVDHLAVTDTSYSLTPGTVPTTYTVTLRESGLASGTGWSAILNGVSRSTTAGSLSFSVPPGSYTYQLEPVVGYSSSAAIGWVNVGSDTSLNLTFVPTPPPASSSPASAEALVVVLAIVILLVVGIVVWALVRRARRGSTLPRHSARGQVTFSPPVGGGVPPPIHLTPSGQPAVQQIVIRETVKVNCRYCGSLIDSTVTNCPFCGATRN